MAELGVEPELPRELASEASIRSIPPARRAGSLQFFLSPPLVLSCLASVSFVGL